MLKGSMPLEPNGVFPAPLKSLLWDLTIELLRYKIINQKNINSLFQIDLMKLLFPLPLIINGMMGLRPIARFFRGQFRLKT
jgi:hypothetical protein